MTVNRHLTLLFRNLRPFYGSISNVFFGPRQGIFRLIGCIRVIICLVIVLRFCVYHTQLHASFLELSFGYWLVIAIVLYLITIFTIGAPPFGTKRREDLEEAVEDEEQQDVDHTAPPRPPSHIRSEIVADVLFFSAIYFLTLNASSNVSYFFILPVFISIVFFRVRWGVLTTFTIMVVMSVAALLINALQGKYDNSGVVPTSTDTILANILFPHSALFVVTVPFAMAIQQSRTTQKRQAVVSRFTDQIRSSVTEKEVYYSLLECISKIGFDRTRLYLLNRENTHFISHECYGQHSNSTAFRQGKYRLSVKADDQLMVWHKKAIRCRSASRGVNKRKRSPNEAIRTTFGLTYLVNDQYERELDKEDVVEWADVLIASPEIKVGKNHNSLDGHPVDGHGGDVGHRDNFHEHPAQVQYFGKISVDRKYSRWSITDFDLFLLHLLANAAAEALHRCNYRNEIKHVIAILGHDVRHFLSLGKLRSHLLQQDGIPEQKKADYLEELRYLVILGEMALDCARYSLRLDTEKLKISLTPVTLKERLSDVLEGYRLQAKHQNVSFEVQLPDNFEQITIRTDITIALAFHTIVENAIKYIPTSKDEKKVEFIVEANSWLEIRIRDTGAGIAEEERTKIFSPKFRGTSSSKTLGYGMGLAIAKDIIERHYGSVSLVHSVQGEGSTFLIKLPYEVSDGKKR